MNNRILGVFALIMSPLSVSLKIILMVAELILATLNLYHHILLMILFDVDIQDFLKKKDNEEQL